MFRPAEEVSSGNKEHLVDIVSLGDLALKLWLLLEPWYAMSSCKQSFKPLLDDIIAQGCHFHRVVDLLLKIVEWAGLLTASASRLARAYPGDWDSDDDVLGALSDMSQLATDIYLRSLAVQALCRRIFVGLTSITGLLEQQNRNLHDSVIEVPGAITEENFMQSVAYEYYPSRKSVARDRIYVKSHLRLTTDQLSHLLGFLQSIGNRWVAKGTRLDIIKADVVNRGSGALDSAVFHHLEDLRSQYRAFEHEIRIIQSHQAQTKSSVPELSKDYNTDILSSEESTPMQSFVDRRRCLKVPIPSAHLSPPSFTINHVPASSLDIPAGTPQILLRGSSLAFVKVEEEIGQIRTAQQKGWKRWIQPGNGKNEISTGTLNAVETDDVPNSRYSSNPALYPARHFQGNLRTRVMPYLFSSVHRLQPVEQDQPIQANTATFRAKSTMLGRDQLPRGEIDDSDEITSAHETSYGWGVTASRSSHSFPPVIPVISRRRRIDPPCHAGFKSCPNCGFEIPIPARSCPKVPAAHPKPRIWSKILGLISGGLRRSQPFQDNKHEDLSSSSKDDRSHFKNSGSSNSGSQVPSRSPAFSVDEGTSIDRTRRPDAYLDLHEEKVNNEHDTLQPRSRAFPEQISPSVSQGSALESNAYFTSGPSRVDHCLSPGAILANDIGETGISGIIASQATTPKFFLGDKQDGLSQTETSTNDTQSTQHRCGYLGHFSDRKCSKSYLPAAEPVLSIFQPIVDLTGQVRTIEEDLDSGCFAVLHLGEWRRGKSKSEVAIKMLKMPKRIHGDRESSLNRCLAREALVWHRLDHPNITAFHGISAHIGGWPAIIIPWNTVTELANIKISLVKDMAEGLLYLHSLTPPIIHGDLKGNNILISNTGRALLSDYGIVQVVEESSGPSGFSTTAFADSMRWQAPEIVAGELFFPDIHNSEPPASGRFTTFSDVWAFSCTAYELLTNRVPYYQCLTAGTLLQEITGGKIPVWVENDQDSVKDLCEAPVGLRNVLESGWAFHPRERPVMAQLKEQLTKSPCETVLF